MDKTIHELPDLVRPGDVWVLNNTKVIPARLFGMRGTARIELLLHKPLATGEGTVWQCFAKPGKKLRVGDVVTIAEDLHASVQEKRPDGQVVLSFNSGTRAALFSALERYGHVPLPPYIQRDDTAADKSNYQTVFAKHEGSVAAPTASLHLTPGLMQRMRDAGATFVEVTLHVGGGTFLPVKVEDTAEHVMHSEWCDVSNEAASAINAARAAGGRVVAVGTTALRTIESMVDEDGQLVAGSKETDIFITPGTTLQVASALLTNFHLPRSTLLMLVCAVAGYERMMAAYAHAVASNYRFFSYGDACFLEYAPND